MFLITGTAEFWERMLLSLLGLSFERDLLRYLLPSAFSECLTSVFLIGLSLSYKVANTYHC